MEWPVLPFFLCWQSLFILYKQKMPDTHFSSFNYLQPRDVIQFWAMGPKGNPLKGKCEMNSFKIGNEKKLWEKCSYFTPPVFACWWVRMWSMDLLQPPCSHEERGLGKSQWSQLRTLTLSRPEGTCHCLCSYFLFCVCVWKISSFCLSNFQLGFLLLVAKSIPNGYNLKPGLHASRVSQFDFIFHTVRIVNFLKYNIDRAALAKCPSRSLNLHRIYSLRGHLTSCLAPSSVNCPVTSKAMAPLNYLWLLERNVLLNTLEALL